jgi:hypothetical protein
MEAEIKAKCQEVLRDFCQKKSSEYHSQIIHFDEYKLTFFKNKEIFSSGSVDLVLFI